MSKLTLRKVVVHPATVASSLVALLGGLLNVPFLDALLAVVWSQAGSLFTVLSIGGFTLAPRVAFIPEEPLAIAAIGGAAIYGIKLLYGVYQNFEERV